MAKLTQKRLKEVLYYDPDAGIFRWLVTYQRVKTGDIAGSVSKTTGYRCIYINGKSYIASRLAYLYMEGYFPEYEIDHKDGNKNNDVWSNLRHVSHLCNMRNQKIRRTNTSGVTGVYWEKRHNKWYASICMFGKRKYLGSYINFIDAVKARWKAEKKYGWPGCDENSSAFNYLKQGGII